MSDRGSANAPAPVRTPPAGPEAALLENPSGSFRSLPPGVSILPPPFFHPLYMTVQPGMPGAPSGLPPYTPPNCPLPLGAPPFPAAGGRGMFAPYQFMQHAPPPSVAPPAADARAIESHIWALLGRGSPEKPAAHSATDTARTTSTPATADVATRAADLRVDDSSLSFSRLSLSPSASFSSLGSSPPSSIASTPSPSLETRERILSSSGEAERASDVGAQESLESAGGEDEEFASEQARAHAQLSERAQRAQEAAAASSGASSTSPLTAVPSVPEAPPPAPSVEHLSAVSVSMLALYDSLHPTLLDTTQRARLVQRLQETVQRRWPHCNPSLNLFGSSANEFGLARQADLDICLTIDKSAGTPRNVLLTLADQLRRRGMRNVKALARARVPIVKFQDPHSGLQCDICLNNHLALYNTRLLATYARLDPRCRQLGYVVKYWTKKRQINDTYQGTLSSYAYTLMICEPGQAQPPHQWVSGFDCYFYQNTERLQGFGDGNRETLGELLAGFFRLYAYEFDYENCVVSPRTARYLTKAEKNWLSPRGKEILARDNFHFCLEDPFELTHNLGRVVDAPSLQVIRSEFVRACKLLSLGAPLQVVCADWDAREQPV